MHKQNITLSFFLLLSNAIIRVKDIKVVQFKIKFLYVIPGRQFFTTSKEIYKIKINLLPSELIRLNVKFLKNVKNFEKWSIYTH